jgi:hypothetical protein
MRFLVALTLVLAGGFYGYTGLDGFAQSRRRRRPGSRWAVMVLIATAIWCLVSAAWVLTQTRT